MMIKDRVFWEDWEARAILSEPADFPRNLRLVEAMYEEALSLGVFKDSPGLEGLESRFRLATALNARTTS
jgi:hypothetical protein